MLRGFMLATRKLLAPRPLPLYTLTPDVATPGPTQVYDVRRSSWASAPHRSGLPLAACNRHPLLGPNTPLLGNFRHNSVKKDFQIPDPGVIACNMINMLKCVDLAQMKDAPPPAFWLALVGGGMQVVFPLLEIIGGYCDAMTIFELNFAAMTVGFLGGVKWGLAVSKNPVPQPNWDTFKWVALPTGIALVGLLLPYPLGFLTVAGAVVSTLYLDLKSCALPPWANATRLFLTVTTLAGLSMALIAYLLFHNAENEKKKEEKREKKKKEQKAANDDEEDDDDEDDKGKNNGKNK